MSGTIADVPRFPDGSVDLDLSFLDGEPILEPWDLPAALRLMTGSDDLVEQLGVPGTDPEIVAAVGDGMAAHARKDLAGLRRSCERVAEAARRLAAARPPE